MQTFFDGWYPRIAPTLTKAECAAINAYADHTIGWIDGRGNSDYKKLYVQDEDLFKGLSALLRDMAYSAGPPPGLPAGPRIIAQTDLWILDIHTGGFITEHVDDDFLPSFCHVRINIPLGQEEGSFKINGVDFGCRDSGEAVIFRPDIHPHSYENYGDSIRILSFGALLAEEQTIETPA